VGFRISLIILLLLASTACSGGAVQRANDHSKGSVPAGRAPTEVRSPLASEFSVVDWPVYARRFFGCLPPSGESWDQFLPEVRYVDVTGDGVPEALAIGACPSPTSGYPSMVVIFSGTSSRGHLREIGRLPESRHDYFVSLRLTITGGVLTLHGSTYSSGAPLCCPNVALTISYRWRGERFIEIRRSAHKIS
jgi:hypothetical protein